MSTKFTRLATLQSPPAPLPALLQTAAEWVMQGLQIRLAEAGHATMTAPQLLLFAHLDCGATHASAVAQRMGVTRQAVYRTVRELQALGFVTLHDDAARGNQKVIVMTPDGEALALAGRAALGEQELLLEARIGPELAAGLRRALEAGWGAAA